jgi:hypothetical protein
MSDQPKLFDTDPVEAPGYANSKTHNTTSRRRWGLEVRQETLERWTERLEAAKIGQCRYTVAHCERMVRQSLEGIKAAERAVGELEDDIYADWEPDERLTPEGQRRIRRRLEG